MKLKLIELQPPQDPPKVNDSLLCVRCGDSYRVVSTDSLLRSGYIHLMPCNDRERAADAEMSYCPACHPATDTIGVTFFRPVPSRRRLREALVEALDAWAQWSPRNQRIADLRREFNL